MTKAYVSESAMVFGMKLFGTSSSSSPGKESVDSGAPRKTDRVEVPSPAGANAPVLAEEPLEQINIPGFPGGHISSMQAAEPLAGENAMGTLPRDSTATSYSGFQPATARTSAATMMPSVSMVLEGAAEKAAHARTEPVSTEVPLEAHGVPLNAIPDFVLNEHPELKLANYDLSRGNICSNAIAMPHNACRLEMSDMWSDILPSLQSRPVESLTREDTSDLSAWWGGFARFSLTTSLVDDLIMKRAYKDIIEDFDKDAQMIRRNNAKFTEKNSVTLEIVERAMGKSVECFSERPTADNLEQLIRAWQQLSITLCDIYNLVEDTLNSIDRWRRDDIATHRDLEKKLAAVYTNRKRWGSDDTKRGELVIVLTRWVGSEHVMRNWMTRNLGKKEVKCIDRWMDEYRGNRLQLIDSFHQRRAL